MRMNQILKNLKRSSQSRCRHRSRRFGGAQIGMPSTDLGGSSRRYIGRLTVGGVYVLQGVAFSCSGVVRVSFDQRHYRLAAKAVVNHPWYQVAL